MMSILPLLVPFRMAPALSGLLGACASAATVALLAATSAVLAEAGRSVDTLATFALLCLIAFGGNALSDVVINAAGQKLVAELGRSLAERILAAPVDWLKHYRAHRLMPVLTGDIDAISDLALLFAPLATAGRSLSVVSPTSSGSRWRWRRAYRSALGRLLGSTKTRTACTPLVLLYMKGPVE